MCSLMQEHLGFAGAAPVPMLTSPYGAKLNCLSPPLPTIGAATAAASRKSFHPWKKMADAAAAAGHYPFAHAPPHYPASAMTSSLHAAGSRDAMSAPERGIGNGSAVAGGFHGYSHRGSAMSSSCAMVPACVLPPAAGATASVPTGIIIITIAYYATRQPQYKQYYFFAH